MARKSAAALATPALMTKHRAAPPAELPESSAALWTSICNGLPVDAFAPGDLPLLSAYCLAAHQKASADVIAARDGLLMGDKANPAIKLSMQLASVMAALAGKLRLCPSSRTRPESASLKKSFSESVRPWETSPDVSEYFT